MGFSAAGGLNGFIETTNIAEVFLGAHGFLADAEHLAEQHFMQNGNVEFVRGMAHLEQIKPIADGCPDSASRRTVPPALQLSRRAHLFHLKCLADARKK